MRNLVFDKSHSQPIRSQFQSHSQSIYNADISKCQIIDSHYDMMPWFPLTHNLVQPSQKVFSLKVQVLLAMQPSLFCAFSELYLCLKKIKRD